MCKVKHLYVHGNTLDITVLSLKGNVLKKTAVERLESSASSTPKSRVKKPKLDKDLSVCFGI